MPPSGNQALPAFPPQFPANSMPLRRVDPRMFHSSQPGDSASTAAPTSEAPTLNPSDKANFK